jgi:hypothetical protein
MPDTLTLAELQEEVADILVRLPLYRISRYTLHKKDWEMRPLLLLAVILSLSPLACFAQSAPTLAAIKVQVDANQWNRGKLLEKLNQQGSKHGMKFVLADEGKECDYRISFKTGKTSEARVVQGTGGTMDYDTGFAAVYDSQGAELFQIKHEAFWNEAGAINGTAKEIIRRLKILRGGPAKKEDSR